MPNPKEKFSWEKYPDNFKSRRAWYVYLQPKWRTKILSLAPTENCTNDEQKNNLWFSQTTESYSVAQRRDSRDVQPRGWIKKRNTQPKNPTQKTMHWMTPSREHYRKDETIRTKDRAGGKLWEAMEVLYVLMMAVFTHLSQLCKLHTNKPVLWYSLHKPDLVKQKTKYIQRELWGTSLAVQWLRLCISNADSMGSVAEWGTKIPRATQSGQKKKPNCGRWFM